MDAAAAMDEAVEAAVRTGVPGEAPPTPEMIAAARAKAEEMVKENEEGLRDLQNLTLSMGLPAVRALYRHMVEASGLRGAAKKNALREIDDFSPVTEVGCMKVDFHDRVSNRGRVAYLLVDQCPKDHDLTAQIEKLRPLCADDKWPEVVKHLSMLVHITRSVYNQVSRAHEPLLAKLAPDHKADFLDLKVDMSNTTMFLDAYGPTRIGIFIKLDTDVEAEEAQAKADAVKKGSKR